MFYEVLKEIFFEVLSKNDVIQIDPRQWSPRIFL